MRIKRKKWEDLSPNSQRAVVALGIAEAVLTAYSLFDLAQRDSEAVRGPKALWVAGVFVQPVGPIAYLLFGRV